MPKAPSIGQSEQKLTKIQQVRRDIDAERLIRKLNSVIFGRTKLRPDQQFAIKTQLNKVMPDLQAIEYRGETTLNVVQAEPLSGTEWLARHASQEPESPATLIAPSTGTTVPAIDNTAPGLPGFVPARRDSDA